MYNMARFKLSYTETDRAYEYDLSLSYCNPHCNNHNGIDIKWSPLLKRMLGLTDQRLDFTHTGKASIYTSIQKGTIPKLSPFIKALPVTDNLGYNFFPSAKSLIDSLNALIAKSSSILNSKPIDKPAFSLNENEVCTFTEHPKFNITISSYLMKRLRLKNTDTTNTGTSLFIMPTATREFFYIRTDIINSQNYNSGGDVLRVINNDRAVNERVLISFQNFHYFPISARYLSNIQIRITDNHTEEDLPFDREVTCLLHFRRCSSLPSS